MKRVLLPCAFALLSVLSFGADRSNDTGTNVISSVAGLVAALDEGRYYVPFDITATVIMAYGSDWQCYAVQDGDNAAIVSYAYKSLPSRLLQLGDRVRMTGKTNGGSYSYPCSIIGKTAEVLCHVELPAPLNVTAAELTEGRFDNRLVCVSGTVRDAFRDEIDPQWGFLVIQSGRESIYACFASKRQEDFNLNRLVGAEVAVTGLCSTQITAPRRFSGRSVLFPGRDAISVVHPAPSDPFDVPPLTFNRYDHAAVISGMERRRVTGRVIAVWHGDRLLLQTSERQCIVRVDLAEPRPPAYGTVVDAVGTPETDLYRLNLSRAIWCTNSVPVEPEAPPKDITVRQILHDRDGQPAVQFTCHGMAIRLKGIVRSLPSPDSFEGRLALECDRHIVPVDASSCPPAFAGVEIGCALEVAGICLIETENWRPNAPFPHIEGFSVIVRTPGDIRIIARPPWWTTGRLLAVIGTLLAALVGVFAWNRSLNRLAEMRGRELTEETVARVTADLKVGERTRLAIELHDALSQNLTGAALEIETSDVLIDGNPAKAHQHLGIAAKTIRSCREELRNCLWDLRNDALGEKTMDEAIRRTLAPLMDGTGLVVRFSVPRECLSDDTAHALLRIIRELAQNAMRHGHAKTVKVAGSLESDRLLFSVQDDGCGFDPENHLGVRQGHFGLQGIRERVNRFGGTMEIKSRAGKGAKVTIALNLGNGGRQA